MTEEDPDTGIKELLEDEKENYNPDVLEASLEGAKTNLEKIDNDELRELGENAIYAVQIYHDDVVTEEYRIEEKIGHDIPVSFADGTKRIGELYKTLTDHEAGIGTTIEELKQIPSTDIREVRDSLEVLDNIDDSDLENLRKIGGDLAQTYIPVTSLVYNDTDEDTWESMMDTAEDYNPDLWTGLGAAAGFYQGSI
jgi:hypothetical protein